MTGIAPTMRISDSELHLDLKFGIDMHFAPKFGVVHEVTEYDAEPYKGPYEVTPTVDDQVLPTAQKLMTGDLTVKAIPKEYGLVTYDQSRTITVR